MPARITGHIEDVGGSFLRLMKTAPKMARQDIGVAVKLSAFSLGQRMKALAPRSDAQFAPHIQDEIEVASRGLTARVGILEPGPTGIEADVALFNEYAPNAQPFMKPAAEAQTADFKRNVERALQKMEGKLQVGLAGGGLL